MSKWSASQSNSPHWHWSGSCAHSTSSETQIMFFGSRKHSGKVESHAGQTVAICVVSHGGSVSQQFCSSVNAGITTPNRSKHLRLTWLQSCPCVSPPTARARSKHTISLLSLEFVFCRDFSVAVLHNELRQRLSIFTAGRPGASRAKQKYSH